MFIIDDILMSPAKGFMWLVSEIHKAATQEIESEAERLTAELSNLYMQLETGDITDEQFDEREAMLLDRLDELNEAMAHARDQHTDDDLADQDNTEDSSENDPEVNTDTELQLNTAEDNEQ